MIVTLLNKDNAKLLQQLKPKSEFKQIIIWHRFQSNRTAQTQSQYQNCLIDPSFQEVKRPPAEDLFEDNEHSIKHTGQLLLTVKIKDHNIVIDGRDVFEQPVKVIKEHMIVFGEL